jgi:hypothetical protein
MSRSYDIDDLLNGPPPEVLDEVAAAWERAQEPHLLAAWVRGNARFAPSLLEAVS